MTKYFLRMNINMPMNNSVWTRMRRRHFVLIAGKWWTFLHTCCLPFEEPFEPPHDKTNNVAVRPAKTQISLGICPVWSESSLSAWRKAGTFASHWTHSEGSEMSEIEHLLETFNVLKTSKYLSCIYQMFSSVRVGGGGGRLLFFCEGGAPAGIYLSLHDLRPSFECYRD